MIDSLAGVPLAKALVQLVSANRQAPFSDATETDPMGRFTFADVPEGQYMMAFLHPVLDSLGLAPMARSVSVSGRRTIRADLAVPGATRLKDAYCGAEAGGGAGSAGGAIMGFVRAAHGGAPVEGATVSGEWLELSIGGQGVARQVARRVAMTGASGAFVLCGVPSPGSVVLRVSRGRDDTDRVETDVPARGFLRRDLYLGEARAAARADTAPATDSVLPLAGPRTGSGRLSGTVVAADRGRPLAGAQVSVVNGEPTQTDVRGKWTLTGVPSGTRVLEVRAPGYVPVHCVVDIADGARPVEVTLTRLAVVLDTLRVVALSRTNPAVAAFEERRRSSGMGRFLSAEDIERRRVWYTSDLFDYIPGLTRDRSSDGLLMRSPFGKEGCTSADCTPAECTPAVFLNGKMMQDLSARDLDVLVRPEELAGVEVYRATQVPPQFQAGLSGCGSIVLWTK